MFLCAPSECWLKQRKRDYCAVFYSALVHHIQNRLGALGWCVLQQYNVHSMMMQKNNKKMPHSDSCIWWTKQRPMKKRNTRNARTQSNIFFVRKHWEELFNGVQCVCDSVSLCRHKCVNLFAFSQMYQWFRKRACINEILCIERS